MVEFDNTKLVETLRVRNFITQGTSNKHKTFTVPKLKLKGQNKFGVEKIEGGR